MSEETTPSRRQRWQERLQNTYRVVVLNDDTFEEVTSTKLTGLNVWVIVSTIFVLTALLVWLLIAFTPMKRFIPGYGEGDSGALKRMSIQMEDLEEELQAQNVYIARLRNLMTGQVDTTYEQPSEIDTEEDPPEPVDRIPEDEQLRREMELEDLRRANGGDAREGSGGGTATLETMYFIPPITGNISAGFQPDIQHYGVDVVAPKNSPIKSVMDGVVIQSGMTTQTGMTIGIQHANNVVTFYKHNSELLKNVGDRVRAGEAVAIIGNTGELTDGPHLHFELWYSGRAVDAVRYINFD